MEFISQNLFVKEWPLRHPGDEKFFGYVVGMGVFPQDLSGDEMFAYVDFAYGDTYSRYRLPTDMALQEQLFEFLRANLETVDELACAGGKVWVALTEEGYKVSRP